MTTNQIIIFILFILFVIIFPLINGLIVLIIELFDTKIYVKIGIPISRKILSYKFDIIKPLTKEKIKKKVWNFIFTNDNRIYIFPKLIWSGFYNIRTGYSLRILGEIKNNSIKIIAKISAFSLIHLILTFLGLISLIIWSIFTNQEMIIPIIAVIFLVFLIISNVQTYFAVEDNYISMINELDEIINKASKQ